MESKNLQLRLLYTAKLFCKIEGEIKSFSGEGQLKGLITATPALRGMAKELP